MRRLDWIDLDAAQRRDALARPAALDDPALTAKVIDILSSVKSGGDAALKDYTARFDGALVSDLRVPDSALKAAWDALPEADKAAIDRASANIRAFHTAQMPEPIDVETEPGVFCRRETRAIEVAGLYIPGGTAPLVSTVLMLAIPAEVAGVTRRVVITPPAKDGSVNATVLAACYRCAVTDVFIGGGAQAIAALAYGTQSIPRCDKIYGPGNAWVATAKSLVSSAPGGPAIDMPAGPSEVMVICDDESDPDFVASDLLSQAEHDTVAQVICVASSANMADRVEAAVQSQLAALSRSEIARESLKHARMILASDHGDLLSIINQYAPEHLILQMEDGDKLVPDIRHAGSIFLGPWTPESVGDYASGTNHTLPTYGAARAYSGVTLDSFLKYVSVQRLTEAGLLALGPTVERLADMEGLDAHREAVTLRLNALKQNIQPKKGVA